MSRFARTLVYALIGAVILGLLVLAGGMQYAGTRGMNDYQYAVDTLVYWAPSAALFGALVGGIIGCRRSDKVI